MDYHTAMLRLESAPTRARDWINQNKIDYAIREILDPMKSLMTSRGNAQSVIDAWRVEDAGFMKIELVNDHKFAYLTEHGWGDYDVYPKGSGAQFMGMSKEFKEKYGGANVLKFQMGGETIFAAHTHPRGFAGYKIIESIENWGFYERFLEKLIDGANQGLQEGSMV